MLPKTRIVSALLVGLGLALVVAGLIAPRFLNGDARFPLNLENTTWTLHDPEATVGEAKDDGTAKDVTVPLTRQLHMTVQNPATDKAVALRVGDSLLRGDKGSDFENLVTAATWSMEVDRKTGRFDAPARVSTVMALPEESVDIDGVWLKFPSDVQKENYPVFDPTLRAAVDAEFTGESQLAGRTVYTFTQTIPDTNVAELYPGEQNSLMVPGPDGEAKKAFKHHAAEREITVDQITGLVVGINEKVDDYYADRAGERVREIYSYDAAMDEQQVEALTGQLPKVTQGLSRTVTYAVIGVGTLLALAGLIGAFRPGGRRRAASHRA